MQEVQGSLTMIGLNTPTPQIFWNGRPVLGITRIMVDWEGDDQRIKLKVSNSADISLHNELTANGILLVKQGSK